MISMFLQLIGIKQNKHNFVFVSLTPLKTMRSMQGTSIEQPSKKTYASFPNLLQMQTYPITMEHKHSEI